MALTLITSTTLQHLVQVRSAMGQLFDLIGRRALPLVPRWLGRQALGAWAWWHWAAGNHGTGYGSGDRGTIE